MLNLQDLLNKMRSVDDHIVNSLNNSLPTNSFKLTKHPESDCKELYNTLLEAHENRAKAIKGCILSTAESIKSLKNKREENRDDNSLDKSFKLEQRKVHTLINAQPIGFFRYIRL